MSQRSHSDILMMAEVHILYSKNHTQAVNYTYVILDQFDLNKKAFTNILGHSK